MVSGEGLAWWGDLAGREGIGGDGLSAHIHLVSLISNFSARRDLITLQMLKAVDPLGSQAHHVELLPYLNKYAIAYGLEQPKAIAHFLSQVSHESGLRIVEEGLAFSARQMRKTYGCRTHNGHSGYNAQTDNCDFGQIRSKLWTQESYYAMNAENLGSYVYADRMGNGNEESKEGYKYRGRGMIQVTGKSAYETFKRVHNQKNPSDIQDFVAHPELVVSSMEYGVESAFVFWFTKSHHGNKLSEVAKTGSVVDVTQLVNGGQNGYADRNTKFQSIAALLGVE